MNDITTTLAEYKSRPHKESSADDSHPLQQLYMKHGVSRKLKPFSYDVCIIINDGLPPVGEVDHD